MMSFDTALLNFDQLYLEIPPSSCPPQASYTTAGGASRACLNQMALDAFLPWLQEEHAPRARVWGNPAVLPSFWEFFNGTAIEADGIRIVLLPSDAIDTDELRVPQEWVDIPSWAADYYIAVQVNPDDGWIRVWGYTTHACLKTGSYDAIDRAYWVNEDDVRDLSVLWLTRELCPGESLRAEIAPLPAIATAQATNLIERLGNPEVVLPRQAIPFQLWAALLEHNGWRRSLYQRRQGLPEQWSVSQWLQGRISTLGQQFGWSWAEPQLVTAAGFRGLRGSATSSLVRPLQIDGNDYQLEISPLPDLTTAIAAAWRFQLHSADPNGSIPVGFALRLLTEDLQPFDNNEDVAATPVDRLYVDVIVGPGEGIVWQVEPTPEDYDREILRF